MEFVLVYELIMLLIILYIDIDDVYKGIEIYIYIWIYNIYQIYINEYIMKLYVLISVMRKNEGGMVLFDLG